jgi:hypothetical protein
MRVDPESAQRGVRARLMGAVGAASTTLVCIVYAMLASVGSFGATFALAIGVCSFGAAVALLLSARHEEEVHELAAQFDRTALADEIAADDTASDEHSKPRALPKPNPLSGIELDEPPQLQGIKRADSSAHTDGVV